MFNNPTAQAHRALAQKTSDRKGSVSSTWCLSRCCERFGILVGRAHKGVGLPHRSQGGAQALEPPRGEVGLRWAPSGWLSTSPLPLLQNIYVIVHMRVTVTFGWAFSLDRHLWTSTQRVVQGQHRVVSPGDVTKRHMLPLFSGLTLFLAFAVHWRSWRGPRPTWLCGSFSGQTKPGGL